MPEPTEGPTVLRILLGTQLRRLREAAGITPERAGFEIRASRSKISRLENGRVKLKNRDVTDLLTREAVQFVEKKRAGPFFLYVPYTAVHLPIDEPKPAQRGADVDAAVSRVGPSGRERLQCEQPGEDAQADRCWDEQENRLIPTEPEVRKIAADDLCNRIRKAGGACFVLKNRA